MEKNGLKTESEERFKALFKGIPTPSYIWQVVGDDFVLIDYNLAAEKMTYGKIKEFLNAKASEFHKDEPEILGYLNLCAREHSSIFKETEYTLKSTGDTKYFSVQCNFVPPDLILVHTEDITDKKEAESALEELNLKLEQKVKDRTRKLKESEENFRMIFEGSRALITIIDENAKTLWANPSWKLIFGNPSKYDENSLQFIHPDDLERATILLNAL